MKHNYKQFELRRFIYLLEKPEGNESAPVEGDATTPDELKKRGDKLVDAAESGIMVLRRGPDGKLGWVRRTKAERIKDRENRKLARTAESVEVTKGMQFFRSSEGKVIAFDPSNVYYSGIFVSDDGKIFSKMYEVGSTSNGDRSEYEATYINPLNNHKTRFRRSGPTLVLEDETFTQVSGFKTINVTKTPEVWQVEFRYMLPNGKELVASRDKYDHTYEKRKITIDGKQVNIYDWQTYQDGGTMKISTSAGDLFIPSVLKRDEKPTWNGVEISESNKSITKATVNKEFNILVEQVNALPTLDKTFENQYRRRFKLRFSGSEWKDLLSRFKESEDFKMFSNLRKPEQENMPLGAVSKDGKNFRLFYSYKTDQFQVEVERVDASTKEASKPPTKKEGLLTKLKGFSNGAKEQEVRNQKTDFDADIAQASNVQESGVSERSSFLDRMRAKRAERQKARLNPNKDEVEAIDQQQVEPVDALIDLNSGTIDLGPDLMNLSFEFPPFEAGSETWDTFLDRLNVLIDQQVNAALDLARAAGRLTPREERKIIREVKKVKRALRRTPRLLERAERKLKRFENQSERLIRRAERKGERLARRDYRRELRKFTKNNTEKNEALAQQMIQGLQTELIAKINAWKTAGVDEKDFFDLIDEELAKEPMKSKLDEIYDSRSKLYRVEMKFAAAGSSFWLRVRPWSRSFTSQKNSPEAPDVYSTAVEGRPINITL